MFRKRPRRKAPTTTWGKIWHFIWYEDSFASWLVNIVLAFVLIKFIIYPGLGLIMGTPFPVVAVVSSSMEHHPGDFDEWWAQHGGFYEGIGITKEEFRDYPFANGFNKGDIMVLRGTTVERLDVGDVIVYWSGKPYPIIHRYIGMNEDAVTGATYLMSKGDNNPALMVAPDLDERRIPPERLLGTAIFRIPYLGYVKLWAVQLITVF